jgi:lipopolysaccharide transport system ATP-binding protein
MLELGSGCHPDLTGRENIYLNGSILGLRIAEIRQKFDSIIAFSELGSAVDLPLRTYSAGMSARLAFSVLAHAHRDVLLIDEILAVGDASFQAKCAAFFPTTGRAAAH